MGSNATRPGGTTGPYREVCASSSYRKRVARGPATKDLMRLNRPISLKAPRNASAWACDKNGEHIAAAYQRATVGGIFGNAGRQSGFRRPSEVNLVVARYSLRDDERDETSIARSSTV